MLLSRVHLVILIFAFTSSRSEAQSVIYVNQSATGSNDGTSWINAFVHLQDALQTARLGNEVWVAAGTYHPDQGAEVTHGDREESFVIPSGVTLLGGYNGTGAPANERHWQLYETVLSGDLLDNDSDNVSMDEPTRSDNSLHVVWIPDNDQPVMLEGFVVTSGHANVQGGDQDDGAGILVRGSAVLRHLIIRNNVADRGGGMLAPSTLDQFVLEDTLFENNVAEERGGGLRLWTPSSDLRRLIFRNNRAKILGGGIYILENSGITDATFVGNSASEGGGIYVAEGSSLTLLNSVLVSNIADYGGAIHFQDLSSAHSTIANSIFSGNQALGAPLRGSGGAIFSPGVSFDVTNSTIVGNEAKTSGGGIYYFQYRSSVVNIRNSIIWGNRAGGASDQFFSDPGSTPGTTIPPIITASLIEGGRPANTTDDGLTLDANPLFIDADGADNIPGTLDDNFRLTSGSPAIDSGSNTSLPLDALDINLNGTVTELLPGDFDLNRRIFDGGAGTATVDIGAYEYGASPIVLTFDQATEALPEKVMLHGNYPNPFNPTTTVTYTLNRPAKVRLEIYNLLGKRVRLLESGLKPKGEHLVTFDATGLASGIYLYTLTTADFSQTRKMVMVR